LLLSMRALGETRPYSRLENGARSQLQRTTDYGLLKDYPNVDCAD